MRILHTSDWHLGRNLEGRSRIPEQREFINELYTLIEQESIDLVLIAGDVFDTSNPSAEAEQLFYEALDRISAGGRRAVVAIAGNHDSPERLQAANPISRRHGIFLMGYPGQSPCSVINSSNTGCFEVAAAIDYRVDADRAEITAGGQGWFEIAVPGCREHVIIAALPYPSEQRLNEVISESMEDRDMQKGYSERVAQAFCAGSENFRQDTVNLAVSHLYVLGGRASESERDIQLGGAYVVEPRQLPGSAQYIALGHLHRPQAVGGSPVPCRYSGSPLCYSFSEADQQKEVVVIEALPGQPALINSIKLTSGKPLRRLRFDNYLEAYKWCEEQENHNFWVDMEIQSGEPLDGVSVSALRKLHPGVINIRVILPGLELTSEEGDRVSQLSLEEKFCRFAARESGAAPDMELVALFLELAEGDDSSETD
ncbi:MAG TPA: exonuclease subunit SbcD [Verrucomicrobiae bacterium]|nr:exonuclease subunit SbcD [Verrucomicrobiae bacterium]